MPRRKPLPPNQSLRHQFGAHMSIAGGHERAVFAAHAVGFETVQVFTKSNNQWKAKELTEEQVAAFRHALEETGVSTRSRTTRI